MFTSEIKEKLQYYVYRLIDPRNGETFYIGKGKDNRVFAHIQESIEEDSLTEKMSRIRDIKLAGFDVAHVIHRHGMSEKVAFEVEAALIDAYPGLSNIMTGHGNNDVGIMHSKEVIAKYSADIAVFEHDALLINVNKTALEADLYEATRFAWRLNAKKAEKAEVILAVVQGVIKGAFKADKWLSATSENFSGRETVDGRYGFVGSTAPQEILDLYVGKRLPEDFRKRGASNPIKYTY